MTVWMERVHRRVERLFSGCLQPLRTDRGKREALTAWGRRVEVIVGGGPAGAVVPFPVQSVVHGAGDRDVDWGRSDRGGEMKTITIGLPEALAERLQELVKAGWFTSEEEIGRLALADLVGRRRYELQERFQREDVAWAAAQKAGAVTSPDPHGERERFVAAVEEGLADTEAGRVISDEELGTLLDAELGPLEPGDLNKRLRKDRPMTTISLRMPEDVVEDLKRVAPRLGFSGYQPLVRAYVGQGLRRDLEVSRSPEADEVKTARSLE